MRHERIFSRYLTGLGDSNFMRQYLTVLINNRMFQCEICGVYADILRLLPVVCRYPGHFAEPNIQASTLTKKTWNLRLHTTVKGLSENFPAS